MLTIACTQRLENTITSGVTAEGHLYPLCDVGLPDQRISGNNSLSDRNKTPNFGGDLLFGLEFFT